MIIRIIMIVCLTAMTVSATVFIDYKRAIKGKKSFFWTKGGDE